MTAGEVSQAIEEGIRQSGLACTTECFPVGDGGDGTAELISERFGGEVIQLEATDALGRSIEVSYGIIDDGLTAVIEMANASGIRLLDENELDPLQATSFGTGEMIRSALDQGVNKIIIGLGGSATVDGGSGMLKALGVEFLDSDGNALYHSPKALEKLARIDISNLDGRVSACNIVVLCDVDNCLLGKEGSAAIFGPQKGAQPEDVPTLDAILRKISDAAFISTKKRMDTLVHGGAAGGVAAALAVFLNAELVAGAQYFLTLSGFDNSLRNSDLVITAEGSLDEQTLKGKAPFAVANFAKQYNLPVIGIAGRVPLTDVKELNNFFDILLPIGHQPSTLDVAIKNTRSDLIRTGAAVGKLIALSFVK